MREELLDPEPGPDDDVTAEATLRPRRLAEFVGQSELKDHLGIVLEAARRRGQAPDHLLFAGPAGPGQDHAGRHHRHRARRPPADHVGPGARAGRRPRRDPHPARGRRRAVHRRDPPAAPGGRRGALPGDGGLPARHRAGQGPRGPVDPARPARGSPSWAPPPARGRSPARCATASGSSPASTTTRPTDLEAIVVRGRGHPRRGHRPGRVHRDRPARPGHARASPTACCGGSATTPRSRGDGRSTRPPPSRGLAVFGVDERGLDKVDRAILVRAVRAVRRRPGRAVHPGHQRGRADRDGRGRLRAVPHPAGPAHADTPRAGWPCRPPGTTSAWRHRPRPAPTARRRRCSAPEPQRR